MYHSNHISEWIFLPRKHFVPLNCDTFSYSALIFLWPGSCDIFYILYIKKKNLHFSRLQFANQIIFFPERKYVDVLLSFVCCQVQCVLFCGIILASCLKWERTPRYIF